MHLRISNSTPLPGPLPLGNHICSLHLWVCFYFVDKSIGVILQIPHISDIRWYLSFWLLSICPSTLLPGALFHSFYGWVLFHSIVNYKSYSCLENSMDRGAWWVTVHGVTKSWTFSRQNSLESTNLDKVVSTLQVFSEPSTCWHALRSSGEIEACGISHFNWPNFF